MDVHVAAPKAVKRTKFVYTILIAISALMMVAFGALGGMSYLLARRTLTDEWFAVGRCRDEAPGQRQVEGLLAAEA